jgi:beta-fructofuranosidase/levanase/fructan beta-fructosidase
VGDFDGSEFTLDPDFKSLLGFIPANNPEGLLFEDFESGYDGWTIEGQAFGKEPARGTFPDQNNVEGYEGNYLVNSFFQGDGTTGTLTSTPFKIEYPYINMRVGGGNDTNKTYVALMVNGEVVKKTAGRNGERLDLKSWDVRELIGQSAQIRIVDDHTGGWGHINVDEIKFANEQASSIKEKAFWVDYGADNYAGVTFSNVEDGRKIFMGWMSNWQYATVVPTYKWRSAMTIPRELKLVQEEKKYRLESHPVEEMKRLLSEKEGSDSTYMFKAKVAGDFEIRLTSEMNDEVMLKYESGLFSLDRAKSGKVKFHPDFGSIHEVETNGIRDIEVYVDVSSIEVFLNDGEVVLTDLVFPNKPLTKLETSGGIKEMEVRTIRSIWR